MVIDLEFLAGHGRFCIKKKILLREVWNERLDVVMLVKCF